MSERIKNYKDFYEFYLTQHQKTGTKVSHILTVIMVFAVVAFVIKTEKERFLWYIPILGWGITALSHYIFEKNTPTSFRYPLWTIISDFRFFLEVITGKRKV